MPRDAKRMKPVKGWAVVEDGKLAVFDYRLPLCWRRDQADAEAVHKAMNARVVRVLITELPPKSKPHAT